ncbi:hypothetical protein DFH27DRAFT_539609 [Peziza echinospora]|nr:hypothetical protein DFH27DRAFT_539609 [Peziza echinospora]
MLKNILGWLVVLLYLFLFKYACLPASTCSCSSSNPELLMYTYTPISYTLPTSYLHLPPLLRPPPFFCNSIVMRAHSMAICVCVYIYNSI